MTDIPNERRKEEILPSHNALNTPPYCPECGADEVVFDAFVDHQGGLVSMFDSASCNACGKHDIEPKWKDNDNSR